MFLLPLPLLLLLLLPFSLQGVVQLQISNPAMGLSPSQCAATDVPPCTPPSCPFITDKRWLDVIASFFVPLRPGRGAELNRLFTEWFRSFVRLFSHSIDASWSRSIARVRFSTRRRESRDSQDLELESEKGITVAHKSRRQTTSSLIQSN